MASSAAVRSRPRSSSGRARRGGRPGPPRPGSPSPPGRGSPRPSRSRRQSRPRWRSPRGRGPGPRPPRRCRGRRSRARPGSRSRGCPVSSVPVDGEDGVPQPVARALDPPDGRPAARRRRGRGDRHAHGPRHVLRARPAGGAPATRRAAGPGCGCRAGRRGRRPPSDPRTCGPRSRGGRRPSAAGSMSSQRRRLDRVHVEQDPPARADPPGDLGDRLDRADLVVGQHQADQDRLVGERGLELVGVDPAVPVDRAPRRSRSRTSRGSAGRGPRRGARSARSRSGARGPCRPRPHPSGRGCWPRSRRR